MALDELRVFCPGEKRLHDDRMSMRDIRMAAEMSNFCPDGNCRISQAFDQLVEENWTRMSIGGGNGVS